MKLKDTLPTAFTALLACVLLCPAARAEESACKADIEKFCKDVQPSEGRIVKCLREHEAELSAECKTKGEELKDRTEGFKEACQADLDKFCKDIQPGEGRLVKCLKERQAELSGTCTQKIAEEKEEFVKGHPCLADMEKLCKDAEKGEGRKLKCMKEHEAELSPECKAKIADRKEEMKKSGPCAADMEKFCKGVQQGEGRVMDCLRSHEVELSTECRARGLEIKEKVAEFKETCQADLDKFCKDIKQGEGRLAKCLKEHQAEVSGPCKAKIAEVKEERQEKIKGGRMGKMKDKRGETLRGRMKKKGMKGAGAQPADEN